MTKITETTPVKKYLGNGATKAFPFGFMYWNNDEIIVQLDGVKQTSGYVITSDDITKGGTVTFSTAPADKAKVIIERKIDNKRYSEFEESGLFRAEVVNDEFNRVVAQIQQLQEASDRSVKVDVNDDETPEELLAEVYEKLDSASAIAADARTAANTATAAANAATAAASQAVSDINSAVNTATASINQTVSTSEASIASTINNAITNVTQAATNAAQQVIDNAAESATTTAKTNINTYVTETVKPDLQTYVTNAASSATSAATTASQFTNTYNTKLSEFNANAAAKQTAVDTSAANAAASATAAANSASAAATSETNAGVSEVNAAQSALLAQTLAQRVRSEGIPMSIIEHRKIEKTADTVKLWWKDPRDTIIDGFVLASWKSTTIVKKQGSYPEDINDGTVVEIITQRNKYWDSPLTDNQANAENWYYRAFPLSVNGVYNLDKRNCFGAVLFGYRINVNEPVPTAKVEKLPYCDNYFYDKCKMDFARDRFGWGSWRDAFFIPKPCALTYAGNVDYYLNPDNFTLKEDGTASDVSNSAFGGNFMCEFPNIFVKFWDEDNYFYCLFSNVKLDDGFECWATKKADGTYTEHFYMPMFEGTVIDGKMRSVATTGKPTASTTAEAEATAAHANGTNWETTTWAQELLLMLLFPLLFESTDSQTALGFGGSHSTTGLTVNNNAALTRGLMHGTSAGSAAGVTYLGLHNWWGHRWRRPNGLMNMNGNYVFKMTPSTVDGSTVTGFNRTGTGYIKSGITPPAASESYIDRYQAIGKLGFVPKTTTGSSTTHFCDGMWTNNGQLDQLLLGGNVYDGALAGVFCFDVNDLPSNSSWALGASVSFTPF